MFNALVLVLVGKRRYIEGELVIEAETAGNGPAKVECIPFPETGDKERKPHNPGYPDSDIIRHFD
jgi:hypothetical protein